MKAIVIGSRGQDGTLMTEFLSARGYSVTGLDVGVGPDLFDAAAIRALVSDLTPREVYYLAAFHHSSEDSAIRAEDPGTLMEKSRQVNVQGLRYFLDAIRTKSPGSRLFYASSSHILGDRSTPYAITKAEGMSLCAEYRKNGIFASSGVLFNHESPLRTENFLSKKIVRGAVRIKRGELKELVLGNLSAQVDWGYAPDFVAAMHSILQADHADDFVVATGKLHSVQEFVETVFGELGLDWTRHVREDASILARQEQPRAGDISKIRKELGWTPKTDFKSMIRKLVEAELQNP